MPTYLVHLPILILILTYFGQNSKRHIAHLYYAMCHNRHLKYMMRIHYPFLKQKKFKPFSFATCYHVSC
jgi:hypothetical protein